MLITTDSLLKRIKDLIQQGGGVLSNYTQTTYGKHVHKGLFMSFRTASLSFILNLYGDQHPYFEEFNEHVVTTKAIDTEVGMNILFAIEKEIKDGYLLSLKRLVSAEIFSDFLEMGKYLLDSGYKDPAAVMIGSVLEEHLRQLCQKNDIDTYIVNDKGDEYPKKAEAMNTELKKKGVYELNDQKLITAWLGLRNDAAHGNYTKYSLEKVDLMHFGVLNFIQSHR